MMHGGNIYQFARHIGCQPGEVQDFSSNINPQQAVDSNVLLKVAVGPYAEPDYYELKQAICARYRPPSGVDIEVFNGASAAIYALLRWLQPKDIVLYTPMYSEYAQIAKQLGCNIHNIQRTFTEDCSTTNIEVHPLKLENLNAGASNTIPRRSTVIFVNPSTPDGQLYNMQALLNEWQAADCTVIIDESFLDFCEAASVVDQIVGYDKLYIVKSLSKFYGCAGIRIGFILAAAQSINKLKKYEPAWKLSSLDMIYMQQALANTSFIEQTRCQTNERRNLLFQVLQASTLFEQIYPSRANFLLAKLVQGMNGIQLQATLEKVRILIRVCDNFEGLDHRYVRFAVKDEAAIQQLADSLKEMAR
ncbi:MAG: aminotransferase class I/II-fold pyridoxal phosphate-dependent enzyme [Methylococcaceae bacterium]